MEQLPKRHADRQRGEHPRRVVVPRIQQQWLNFIGDEKVPGQVGLRVLSTIQSQGISSSSRALVSIRDTQPVSVFDMLGRNPSENSL